MKSLLIPALSILALSASGSALAQTSPPVQMGPGALGLFQFDANQDGKLTAEEFDKAHRDRFNAIDLNKDQTLTRDELNQNRERMRAERQQDRFAKIDANADGTISKAEFEAAQAEPRGPAERAPRMGRMSGHRAPEGRAGRAGPDADGDKAIAYAEFVGRAKERFDRADKNSDGVLTLGEAQTR